MHETGTRDAALAARPLGSVHRHDDAGRQAVAHHVRLVMGAARSRIVQPEDLAPVTDHGERVLRMVTG